MKEWRSTMRWLMSGGSRTASRWLVFGETSHGDRRLELSAPPSPGREEVLKVELMTSGQLFNQAWQLSEAHVRTPKDRQGSESCVLLNTWRCWECGVPGQSVNAPCLFPSILYPIYCCAMFLICMLCNKSAQFKKKTINNMDCILIWWLLSENWKRKQNQQVLTRMWKKSGPLCTAGKNINGVTTGKQ